MSTLLETCVSRIELGEPQRCNSIVVVPVFLPESGSPEYLTLTEALGRKLTTITEVGSGNVPEVKLINHSELFLLLVEGEELIGARQNRTLNTSIYVSPKSELLVPVSCTERGRWHHLSHFFSDSGYVSPHKMRKAKSDSVRASLAREATFKSDQGEVWKNVDHLAECLFSHSPTHAMADAMAAKSQDLENYLHTLKPLPQQKGLVVIINGQVAGIDILSSARAYQTLHPKFIRSYAIDALIQGKAVPVEKPCELAREFLAKAGACAEQVHRAIGCGEDHRFQGQGVAGAALVNGDDVLHLNLYRN